MDRPRMVASNTSLYPSGYTPNGAETPRNGIDVTPTSAPFDQTSYDKRYAQTGEDNANSWQVRAAELAKKTPLGAAILGIGSLLDQGTGGLYGGGLLGGSSGSGSTAFDPTNWGGQGGGSKGSYSGPTNQTQPQITTDPTTGEQYYIDSSGKRVVVKAGTTQPAPKVPWYYPTYTQSWAGLPSGQGGYIGGV
jgi:hypothetical protein